MNGPSFHAWVLEGTVVALEPPHTREEGILRRCQLSQGGRVRDTVMYSVLDSEWPAVKSDLEPRLWQPPTAR